MRKSNKKGETVTIGISIFALYMIANAALVAASVALTPSHRERKALEYCQADGIKNCEDFVLAMNKKEILAYIKDTQERPR
jgi:hypothetical protein